MRDSGLALFALLALLAIASLALGGCASDRRPSARAVVGSTTTEVRELAAVADRHASLRFDMEGLAPVPLVRATVGCVPTWMQIDSGARAHTLPGFLARRAELANEPRASAIGIDAWGPLDDDPLSVREQDEDLPGARAGIAGLISPRRLAATGVVVLDLPRGEMRTASEREALRALSGETSELTAGAERCDGMFVVPAFVEGVHVRLIVDTGTGVPSTDPASPCAEDGVLGVDVLRACVLVFGPGLRIRCG